MLNVYHFVEQVVQDPNAWAAPWIALIMAIGSLVTAVGALVKVLRELRTNTKLTMQGVITGESTHAAIVQAKDATSESTS